VEEKTGAPVELETIVLAIKRSETAISREAGKSVYSVFKDSKLDLKTGFAYVKLKSRHATYEKLVDLMKKLDENDAENTYVVQRVDEISVISPESVAKKIERLPPEKSGSSVILEKRGELAVITLDLPTLSLDVPGIYALATSQLAEVGVSLLTTISSFTRVSFVCSEDDAPLAYNRLNKLVSESRKLSGLFKENAENGGSGGASARAKRKKRE
jgi:aspartokinase